MFKPSKPLGSLKGVFSSIHHPLPLTNRESTKLLNSLKSQFRNRLDKEYGELSDETATLSKKAPQFDPGQLQREQQRGDAHASRRPTDRHLHTILSSPLFRSTKRSSEPAMRKQTRDPMDVFDEASAKGLMTRKAATGCLMAKRKEIMQSSTLSLREAMSDSGAARRVVQWLRFSGEEAEGAFLQDDRLMGELIEFMLAEGMEETVWEWANRLAQDGQALAPGPPGSLLGRLLVRLVEAKSHEKDDKSLNGAYSAILRADHTWRGGDNSSTILIQPWRHLSWSSTVEAWTRARPSRKLFDDFVHISGHIKKPLHLELAHLDLHHPTKPSHERALRFLKKRDLHLPPAASEEATQRFLNRVASMGMDTAKHLTQIGQTDEAEWVLSWLKTQLGGGSFSRGSQPVL